MNITSTVSTKTVVFLKEVGLREKRPKTLVANPFFKVKEDVDFLLGKKNLQGYRIGESPKETILDWWASKVLQFPGQCIGWAGWGVYRVGRFFQMLGKLPSEKLEDQRISLEKQNIQENQKVAAFEKLAECHHRFLTIFGKKTDKLLSDQKQGSEIAYTLAFDSEEVGSAVEEIKKNLEEIINDKVLFALANQRVDNEISLQEQGKEEEITEKKIANNQLRLSAVQGRLDCLNKKMETINHEMRVLISKLKSDSEMSPENAQQMIGLHGITIS